jgi:hypothetical protein
MEPQGIVGQLQRRLLFTFYDADKTVITIPVPALNESAIIQDSIA